jgi:hypothetical protein
MADVPVATDDFNRADADPIGGNWSTPTGCSAARVRHNCLQKSLSGSTPWGTYWSADSFENDQYSQCIGLNLSGGPAGPAVRIDAGSATAYVYGMRSTTIQRFFKIVAGTWTQLGSDEGQTITTSTVCKISAVGTTLSLYADGSLIDTRTDSTIASGSAGVMWYDGQSYDDWEGGNIVAAATGHPTIKRWGGVPGMAINRGVW